ncbi:MAG: MraY family glycosyltransferase [Candidatus Babeliales bacterium]
MQLLPLYMHLFFLGICGFIISFITVPLFIKLAYRLRVLDIPDGALKRHKNPTPYLGGCAIFIGAWAPLFFMGSLHPLLYGIGGGCAILLVLGLVDDIYRIAPYQKFLGQAGVAAWLVLYGVCYKTTLCASPSVTYLFSWLWLATVMNAFNLLDIMDGLATAAALGVSLQLLYISIITHNVPVASVLSCFIGSLFAFLRYNYPPARVYMGDAGSLFIGGFLGALSLCIPWHAEDSLSNILVLCVIFSLPLTELGGLIIIRTLRGIPFYLGSPDHFAIILQQKGYKRGGIIAYTVATSMFFLILCHFFFSNRITIIPFMISVFLVLAPLLFLIAHNSFSILHQIYQK